jgi:hypothetical protein
VSRIALLLAVASFCAVAAPAQDAAREAAIAEYTRHMQDANYPPLFAQAAAEFHVPPDILMGVSFAETRWTQLEWPPGETVSPENGMPHAYGIMALWDNDHFGHSLQIAAALVGESPDLLKTNAFQNMRGAAALLRQLYDQGAKPPDAPDANELESWSYAIAAYTGIPEQDLARRHAGRVFEFIQRGFHEYGIAWAGHPVDLPKVRADLAATNPPAPAARPSSAPLTAAAPAEQPTPVKPEKTSPPWALIGGILLALTVVFFMARRAVGR